MEKLYVACANSDIISVINTETDEVIDKISVHSRKDMLFGSSPNDLQFPLMENIFMLPTELKMQYVLFRPGNSGKVLGYIPTGWYPGSVILNKAGEYSLCGKCKRIGSRNQMTDREGYNSHDHLGSVSIIPLPGE